LATNLHISLTNVKNESRLFKETTSLVNNNVFSFIQIVGLNENGLKKRSTLQDNIKIDRIDLRSRNLPKNILFQLLKYLEFMFVILFKYKNYDVITIHSLGLLPIGVLYKFFNRSKLVYDAHEYETETQGLAGIRKKLSKFVEKQLIKYCDKVIVVSASIANEYKRLYPFMEKPTLVLNTPPFKKIQKRDIFRETLNISKDKTIFLYQGGLSSGRGIEILLDTFKSIYDEKSVIVFMGYGSLEDLIKASEKTYKNIYFHKAVAPDVLLDYTSSADFGISTIEDSCLSYRYCLPNKIFEYLMAEIPVIVSNLYEMKRLVEKNNIGVVAQENSPNGLKEAILKAVQMDKEELQQNIQEVKEVYNWEEQEKVLLDVYKELDSDTKN